MGGTLRDLNLEDEHCTIGVEDTLLEASKRLLSTPGGILVVLDDEDRVKGILREHELIMMISREQDAKKELCKDHMEMDIWQVQIDTPLNDVLKQVESRGPQAVIVIDENSEFFGYFSPSDYQYARNLVNGLKPLKL